MILLSRLTEGEHMILIELEKSQKRSKANQIYRQIKGKILNGELKSGERLPSTRMLAKDIQVSRNTVLTAFDMLVSEGLVDSIPGSGLYVSQVAGQLPISTPQLVDNFTSSLSAERIPAGAINFDSGIPALSLFPRGKWNREVSHAFLDAPISALGYDDPQGRPELRRALSIWLERARGVRCSPDQIIITSGAKQGLTLVAKCLLQPDSQVLLEDPSNANVRQIFSYHTEHLIPIPVDEEGIITDALPPDAEPMLLFVTPSHQFPMGGVLSLERRLTLIQYARQKGSFLVEDDYDSEFRYDGAPVRSLFELDSTRVIYVGTFSKVMFPSLRLGYLVLPAELVGQFLEWKRLGDHHSNSIYQLALARFIESGELEKHILRMKKVYAKRRRMLLELLQQLFPGQVSCYGDAAGLHVVAAFRGVIFTPDLIRQIWAEGVYIVPVGKHALCSDHKNQIILGYAQLEREEMERGLMKLQDCLKNRGD